MPRSPHTKLHTWFPCRISRTSSEIEGMDATVHAALRDAEDDFLKCFSAGQDLSSVNQQLSEAFHKAAVGARNGTVSASTIAYARQMADAIGLLSQGAIAQQAQGEEIRSKAVKAFAHTARIAASSGTLRRFSVSSSTQTNHKPSLQSHCAPQPPSSILSEHASLASHHAPYRQYVLSHFTHPYPSAAEKAALLTQVPGDTAQKLANFFMNSRKRSGWGQLRDKHGYGCQEGMEKLQKRIEDGTAGAEEAAAYWKVWNYFDGMGKVSVSEKVLEGAGDVVVPEAVRKVSSTSSTYSADLLVTPTPRRHFSSSSSSSTISYAESTFSTSPGSSYSASSESELSPFDTSSPSPVNYASASTYSSPTPHSSSYAQQNQPSYIAPLPFPLTSSAPGTLPIAQVPHLLPTYSAPLPPAIIPPIPADFLTLPPSSDSPSEPHPFFETLAENPFAFSMPQTIWPLDAQGGESVWNWEWDSSLVDGGTFDVGVSAGGQEMERRASWS